MIPSAPKFRKIVLLLKDVEGKPSDRVEYLDSAMIITGNYVIITEEKEVSIDNPSNIDGRIYQMENIHSYKLYKD
jgi:type IV secretory pathway protease TraF